jgi:hypothetical protein
LTWELKSLPLRYRKESTMKDLCSRSSVKSRTMQMFWSTELGFSNGRRFPRVLSKVHQGQLITAYFLVATLRIRRARKIKWKSQFLVKLTLISGTSFISFMEVALASHPRPPLLSTTKAGFLTTPEHQILSLLLMIFLRWALSLTAWRAP